MLQKINQGDDAARREFIRTCMARKLASAPPYSSSTDLLPIVPGDSTKSGTTTATASSGFDLTNIPTSYMLIGGAVLAYLLFKKK